MRDTLYARARKAHQSGLEAIGAGHYPEAVDLLRGAVSLRPKCGRYRVNLAVTLERAGMSVEAGDGRRKLLEESVAESLEAIRLRPKCVDAITNMSLVLESLGRNEEALSNLERAVELAPRSPIVAWCYAGALLKAKRWPEAAHWYGGILKRDPGSDEASGNMVSALSSAGRNAEALSVLYEALERNPGNAITWTNAGCIFRALGRSEAALECLDRAAAIDPVLANASWSRSLVLLSMGRLTEGWAGYEYGLKTGDRQPKRELSHPRWDGSGPAGKTVLVRAEQGIGDHITFAGMVPDLARMGARPIMECDHRLVTLFQRSFPGAEVIPQTDPPQPRALEPGIDYEIQAASLMQWLRPNIESFPRHGGYLVADPERAAVWKERIKGLGPGPKIGISWRSLKVSGVRSTDGTSLNQWGPILTIPGIHWVNLQCGWMETELQEVGDLFDAGIHVWQGLDLKDGQDELAALISGLDLVVSMLTVTAQMAGALGVPAWVMPHMSSRGLWGLGTDHCPWQPSIRFFPCGVMEPWEAPIERLAVELRLRYVL
jgi:tetratricopeptide (TPR) repeat protein